MPPPSDEDLLERVQGWVQLAGATDESYDRALMQKYLHLHSASYNPAQKSGRTTFRFVVDAALTNRLGNLHGGATATIFDVATTSAIVPTVGGLAAQVEDAAAAAAAAASETSSSTKDSSGTGSGDSAVVESWIFGGVSRTLNVTYLRPVPAGTEVDVESEVVSLGRKLALIRGVLRRVKDGAILATCEHNKVAVEAPGQVRL